MPSARIKATIRRASQHARRRIHELDADTRAQLKALYRQAADDVEATIENSAGLDGTVRLEQLGRLRDRLQLRLVQLEQHHDLAAVAVDQGRRFSR